MVLARLTTFAALLAAWLAPCAARAELPRSSWCPAGNLLAGRRPSSWQDLRGDLALVTDGAVAPEGAEWNAPVAVTLETAAGSVTFDLGQPTHVSAVFVQADANDTYKILGSLDGTPGSYKLLADVDNVRYRGHGLRSRSIAIRPEPVRFLRVGEGEGDGLYSISEIAAYCEAPVPFPPVMRQVDAPAAVVASRPWYRLDWWTDPVSARLEMAIALVALALLAWGHRAERTGQDLALPDAAPKIICGLCVALHLAVAALILCGTDWLPAWTLVLTAAFAVGAHLRLLRRPRPSSASAPPPPPPSSASGVRDQLLAMLGILSFAAYWNFGAFHFWNYTHYHEAYHYYVGSKYFAELSYDRLYECTAVADAEDPLLRRRVELRKITNLRTNVLEGTADILAHPERCKQHFSPERWAAFKHDIAFFRTRNGVKRWEETQFDHGYNATPVWNVLGNALASVSPASDDQLWYLTRIDPLLIFGMVAAIWWAFGWRVLCVALAVFATNFPSRFFWTGGAYLRWDWLFHMTAGVCLIKKGRPVLGGFLVGYAALLRVFPGFLFVGPLLVVIQQLALRTKGQRQRRRGALAVLLGGALAVATLVPVSLEASGGIEGYRTFIRNSAKHTATPLTNNMGWRTVVGYREPEAGRHLRDDRLEDPWQSWKEARLRTFHGRLWLYLAGVVGALVLLHRAVRGVATWEATALGATLIAVVPELTSYYYSFLVVPALLWATRRRAGLALLAVTATTSFIDWAPTQFLPDRAPWTSLQMPTWLDEKHTLMSAVTLLGLAYILLGVKDANDEGPAAKRGRPPP